MREDPPRIETRYIRVNLRFGPGTDPALWDALHALKPYARAKLVRELMLAGFRQKIGTRATRPRGSSGPAEAPPTPSGKKTLSADQLSGDILALVGSAVRM